MKTNSSLLVHFPELHLDETGVDVSQLGLFSTFISIFDHWLTEDEAESCPLISYSLALEAGYLDEYLAGEEKFIRLYSCLASGGVICNSAGALLEFLPTDLRFRQLMIESLREKRLMDLYFLRFGVRIIGGYDRTDLAIADSPVALDVLQREVEECGLHNLSAGGKSLH